MSENIPMDNPYKCANLALDSYRSRDLLFALFEADIEVNYRIVTDLIVIRTL